MTWIIEESDDCGIHWCRAAATGYFFHPRVAILEAMAIIEDEWRPPQRAYEELTSALHEESVAYYWQKAIRIVRSAAWA